MKYLIFQSVTRLVRSEGGRICCDFNGLADRTGSEGAYQT
jgi:hypothetical protein